MVSSRLLRGSFGFVVGVYFVLSGSVPGLTALPVISLHRYWSYQEWDHPYALGNRWLFFRIW
jgi:hypothetical protein